MSQHAVRAPVPARGKPVPVRWAMLGGVVIGLIALAMLNGSESEPFDPTTIVPVSRFEEMRSRYQRVGFDVLAGFDYGSLPGANPSTPAGDVIPGVVQQLDGQPVGIEGFMLPLDFDGEGVSEFLLNASYDMCYFGAPTLPNQFVVVRMEGDRRTRFVHTPIVAFGTLRVRPEHRDGRVVSLYHLEADGIGLGAGR